jgi:regulator of RNase E activity RraB
MTLDELAALLERATEDFRRSTTHWQFAHQGVPMACLTDPSFDRMRFIAPIKELSKIDEETKDAVLEANFHTALDARYGSSNGLLFAAFIHPLSSLEAELAHSALDQVASLVQTFGTHYSGGTLELIGGREPNVDVDIDDDDDDDDGPLLN